MPGLQCRHQLMSVSVDGLQNLSSLGLATGVVHAWRSASVAASTPVRPGERSRKLATA